MLGQGNLKFLQFQIWLLILHKGVLSRPPFKNEDIIEGDILWDGHLDEYWDGKQKRSTGNNLSTARNGYQNGGNSSQTGANSSQTGENSFPTGSPINRTTKQVQGGSSTANVWKYKTFDNKGSLTFTIPYEVSAMRDPQSVVFIRVAMKEWNKGTCVLFVPRTTESNYVSFRPGNECSSHVGMVGGKQFVTISPGCQYDNGALMHELGHVLGLFHEHTRPDRDQYVEIIQDNLMAGKFDTNFKKMVQNPPYVRDGNYDYISVMHYGKSHFSKPPYNLTTIRTLDPLYQDVIGQRTVLSAKDVEKVNFIFNCDCKIVNTTHTYTRRYWGECSYLFGLITWRCIKEEDVTEVWSEKKCADMIPNGT
ncbi:hypothetical protein ACHWQZ_G005664 [Mnemiopsis leidyi]